MKNTEKYSFHSKYTETSLEAMVCTGADPETRGGGVTEKENCTYIIVFDCPWLLII